MARTEGGKFTIGVMSDGGEDEYPDEETATANQTNGVATSSGNATTDRVGLSVNLPGDRRPATTVPADDTRPVRVLIGELELAVKVVLI